MIYGAHVATNNDFYGIPKRAREMGADAVQIFACNPRGFQVKTYEDHEGERFKAACEEFTVIPYIHMSYITSYGTTDETLRNRSIGSFASMLKVADTLGCAGVVTHLGSHKGAGFEARVQSLADGLVEAIQKKGAQTQVLLENSAGQGGTMGNSLEELAEIYEKTGRHPQIKFCLDTAHLLGAGIEFRTQETLDAMLQKFDSLIGLDNLALLHVNDSKVDLGERKDRHENIGDGYVGLDGFRSIVNHPLLSEVPGILEVPGLDGKGPDAENLNRLKQLEVL